MINQNMFERPCASQVTPNSPSRETDGYRSLLCVVVKWGFRKQR